MLNNSWAGKDPSDTQLLEKEISNIFKSNAATAMMEHTKLVEFLHDELKKLGFNDLEKVDILKHATMIRDPLTKETVIPFETRPTKTDEIGNDPPGSARPFSRQRSEINGN